MRFLGQLDSNRLANLGKAGCYTSKGFVTDAKLSSFFSAKPLTEIHQNSERINYLYLGLDRKAMEIKKLADSAERNYQRYIDTKVPVCGSGAIGWLSKAAGTGAYEECLRKADEARNPVMVANTQFSDMSNKIRELNADYSELMMYAPNVLDWQKLCEAKTRLDSRHGEFKQANLKLAETALRKLQNEATAQEKADNEFNEWERILKMFLDALQALVEMVKSVFESFLRGLTKFTAFITDHPWVLWVGGSVLGLSILAFILRPYISLFNFVSG